jgi:hypothetical protein
MTSPQIATTGIYNTRTIEVVEINSTTVWYKYVTGGVSAQVWSMPLETFTNHVVCD